MADVHDVAILNDVFLALDPELSSLFYLQFASELEQVWSTSKPANVVSKGKDPSPTEVAFWQRSLTGAFVTIVI